MKQTEIVEIKVSLVNFIEFKKVIDIGAEIPEAPCNIPPSNPNGKNKILDF